MRLRRLDSYLRPLHYSGNCLAASAAVAAVLLVSAVAFGAETDQYITWDVELADSADAFNAYLNEAAETFLAGVNERAQPIVSAEELTKAFYEYLFQGLHSSRIRAWVNRSREVDRFPDRSVSFFEYQRMSIYRNLTAFPFILPMARTVRIGDVYLGVDKIGHFFGFGRRYFQRYLRLRAVGTDDEAAMTEVVRWGASIESSFVGGLVDGIFSHGDLEANFQGMLLAKDCCLGENPFFAGTPKGWTLTRPIDIRGYITPDFDESYNNSHYTGIRKGQVLQIILDEFCPRLDEPRVQARFAQYRTHAPSLSKKVIDSLFDTRGSNPQREQSLNVLCGEHTTAKKDAAELEETPVSTGP